MVPIRDERPVRRVLFNDQFAQRLCLLRGAPTLYYPGPYAKHRQHTRLSDWCRSLAPLAAEPRREVTTYTRGRPPAKEAA